MIVGALIACAGEPARQEPLVDAVDVLVIGGGPAGLAAAREAWEAGATVRVLEREDALGGSNLPGALLMFAGSPEQQAQGILDGPEVLLAEWPAITGGDSSAPWVRRFAEDAEPAVHDWLVALGVAFPSPPFAEVSAGQLPRIHASDPDGPSVAERLAEGVPEAVFALGTEAMALRTDSAGRVVGVQARARDRGDGTPGEAFSLDARAVIVATGGFQWDLERVRALRPDLPGEALLEASAPWADGWGHAELGRLGAGSVNLGALGLYAHGVARSDTSREELVGLGFPRAPWFNARGERFVDEGERNSFRVGAVRAAQPGGTAWVLFDAALAAEERFLLAETGGRTLSAEEVLAARVGTRAETLAALAESVDVPAEALEATVVAWNAWLRGEQPDAWRAQRGDARPIGAGPYVAMPLGVSVAKAFGGTEVDLAGRVLREDGTALPGAFACGELTGMAGGTLVGDLGFTGSLTAVLLGGRVAGASAAAEAAAR